MATSSNLGQIEARTELRRRGLMVRGGLNELRLRLLEDDAFGEFEGNLANSSDQQLREVCKRRGIPSQGNRQDLDDKIRSYNQRKQSEQSSNEDGGWLNTGLPKPDDRLGPPTGEKVLGTSDSKVFSARYTRYLAQYENQHGTTEDAWTLQFWLFLEHADMPAE